MARDGMALTRRLADRPRALVWVPGVVPVTLSLTAELPITQPLSALDHSDCTAKVPLGSVMLPDGSLSPQIRPPHAHLSAISPPLTLSLRSMYPLLGIGSMIDSA